MMAISNYDAIKEIAEELGFSGLTRREREEMFEVEKLSPRKSGRKRKQNRISVREGLRRRGYPI